MGIGVLNHLSGKDIDPMMTQTKFNKEWMASRLKLLNHPAKSPHPRGRHHKKVMRSNQSWRLSFIDHRRKEEMCSRVVAHPLKKEMQEDGIILDLDEHGRAVGLDIDQASKHPSLRTLNLRRLPFEIEQVAS